jgi:hypothetical protein
MILVCVSQTSSLPLRMTRKSVPCVRAQDQGLNRARTIGRRQKGSLGNGTMRRLLGRRRDAWLDPLCNFVGRQRRRRVDGLHGLRARPLGPPVTQPATDHESEATTASIACCFGAGAEEQTIVALTASIMRRARGNEDTDEDTLVGRGLTPGEELHSSSVGDMVGSYVDGASYSVGGAHDITRRAGPDRLCTAEA